MDILSLTAVELAKAIREGKTTAVEATQQSRAACR